MIEICCGSFEDAMAAYKGGAKRIELNSALSLGGLTPTLGSLIMTKQYTNLEVITMVRSRGAGFCYSDFEYEQMLEDARLLLAYQADGLAFGFLNEDRTINEARTREFVQTAHEEEKKAVFHRAFDCTKDPVASMELLIQFGVDRVLTSGLGQNVEEGMEQLKQLQQQFGGQIEVLAGCGLHQDNIKQIKEYTKITQFHSSCKDWKQDVTSKGERVSFGYLEDEMKYEVVSKERVKELVAVDK